MQPEGGLVGVEVILGRFNDAGLGSRQDKALKPMTGGFAPTQNNITSDIFLGCKKPTMRESHSW